MDVLTNESIVSIGNEVNPNVVYHPTTVAYLRHLFSPYARIVDELQDIASIEKWIRLNYRGKFIDSTITEMRKSAGYEDGDIISPAILRIAKVATIEHIIRILMYVTNEHAHHNMSNIILPWEIQDEITDIPELSEMFNIRTGTDTLHVTVTVGTKSFIHDLTREFAAGLLLFSKTANINFNVTMFNAPFTVDFLDEENNESGYVYNDEMLNFSVIADNITYTFYTSDFMRGFATGAMWTGVDHHNYWSELREHSGENPEGDDITF